MVAVAVPVPEVERILQRDGQVFSLANSTMRLTLEAANRAVLPRAAGREP